MTFHAEALGASGEKMRQERVAAGSVRLHHSCVGQPCEKGGSNKGVPPKE